MAEDQEADQPIAMTMPVALQGGKQPIHLGLGQMLARPIGFVLAAPLGLTGRITL
jgi:hypothetical protein